MTSPRRAKGSPIKHIRLRISITADRETVKRLRQDGVAVKGNSAYLTIEGSDPADVASRARRAVEMIRNATQSERV